jgi:glycosyltransferase involved in cell wall biosynthesis
MRILVNIQPLSTFTTGYAHRSLLIYLVEKFPEVQFVLVYQGVRCLNWFESYVSLLSLKGNTKIRKLRFYRLVIFFNNLLFLMGIKFKTKYDHVLSFDAENFFYKGTVSTSVVHDLSSFSKRKSSITGLSRIARMFFIFSSIRSSINVIAISKSTQTELFSLFSRRSILIYNCVNKHWKKSKTEGKRWINREYFLWYGGFNQRKNLILLGRAWRMFLKQNPSLDICLVFAGNCSGNYFEKVRAELYDLTEIGKVIFVNSPSDDRIVELVDSSVGVVSTSLHEGFGLTIVEAFSRGRPVCVGNNSASVEVGGGFAIYIDVTCEESIAKGLNKLLLSKFNSNSLVKWSEKFSSASMYDKFQNVLKL